MPVAIDISNKTFGRLSVIRKLQDRDIHGKIRWECLCDPKLGGCGKTVPMQASHLNTGKNKSCGCYSAEIMSTISVTHGYTKFPEYKVWCSIRDRCYIETSSNYSRYGGRGIIMSDEWKDNFEAFYKDMGPRPSKGFSVDRRDNDLGYSKENCYWATAIEQANNRRSNIFYIHLGRRQTLPDWCRELNLNYPTIEQRIRVLGMSFERAITQQLLKRSEITYKGKTQNLGQWCKELNLNYTVIESRIRKFKMSFETAITFIVPTGKTQYVINNITKTLKEWCLVYAIKIPLVIYRLYREWTIEEALSPILYKLVTFNPDPTTGSPETMSLENWCDLLGMDKDTTCLRVLRGETFEDLVKE